jgi:two-component system sensor histidine kinase DegS
MSRAGTEHRHLDTERFLPPRSPRALHYAVVAVTAGVILFLYYAYKQSVPTPPEHYLDWFWSVFSFEFRNHVVGILMLVPMLYATLTLGWRHSAVVVTALLVTVTPYVVSFSYSALTLFESLMLLIIPPALVLSVEMVLLANARERRTKAEKKRARAEVMRQMFSIQEDERRRISQELHDSVAQTLLVSASTAHNLLESGEPSSESARAALESIKENSLNMVAEIRCICQDLRPSILDNLGLVSALKWLVDDLSEQAGLDVDFALKGPLQHLTQDESVAVFRIVQEALNNVKKHAEAGKAKVAVAFDAEGMSIRIKDDGRGFRPERDPHGFAVGGKLGILGMNERAQSIGATLRIHSEPGTGTEVTIRSAKKPPTEPSGPEATPTEAKRAGPAEVQRPRAAAGPTT